MTNINNLGARLNNNINSIGNNANQWHVLAQNERANESMTCAAK